MGVKRVVKEAGFETLAIREGLTPGFEQEHSDPIYATSSFVFESAEQAAATFRASVTVIRTRVF